MLCTLVAYNGRKRACKMPFKFFKQDEKLNNNNNQRSTWLEYVKF